MTSNKVNLYQGVPIPLEKLGADSFEDFMHQVLIIMGNKQGFEITNGPLNSSDHGFDLTGQRLSDQSIICFQCKRYNSKAIGLPVVAEELAKVAINSFIEGSAVKEHYILTTGTLTKDLVSTLRSTTCKEKIIEKSIECLKQESFRSIVKSCENDTVDVIVRNYIQSLEKIVVWSKRDIDNNLAPIWSDIEDSIDKFFKLERLLLEHPRPNFDIIRYSQYLAKDKHESIELATFPASLPTNISITDSIHSSASSDLTNPRHPPLGIDSLSESIEKGNAMLLTGKGGAGKTSSLIHIKELLLNKENIIELPIYIRLSGFRGNFDTLVHDSLGIKYGNWTSLPYSFVLLLDGIDEIRSSELTLFSDQLTNLLKNNNAKAIISLRHSGVITPITLPVIKSCYSIAPLNYRQIILFSESVFEKEDSKLFINEIHRKSNSLGAEALTLPFGLVTAMDYFKVYKNLPDTMHQIIHSVIAKRIKRNYERSSVVAPSISQISETTLIELSEAIAFEVRIVNKKTALYKNEAENIVASALQNIKKRNVFGSSELTESATFSIAIQYEILKSGSDNLYTLDHDIISDCLAAKLLARHWKEYINDLNGKIGWDAWTFAMHFIQENEKKDFIKSLCKVDIALAARCSRESNYVEKETIESIIEEKTRSTSLSIYPIGMFAASILNTEVCINLLNSLTNNTNSKISYNAKRCLARSGNVNFLNSILSDNENMKASGLNPSGGTFDMWFEAPVSVITSIARDRIDGFIKNNIPNIPIALETIERYGDISDLDRLKTVFENTKNRTEFYIVSRTLLLIDLPSAIELLQEKSQLMTEDNLWLESMIVLKSNNYAIHTDNLLNFFLSNTDVSPRLQTTAFEHITKIICSNVLPDNAASLLLEFLKQLKIESNKSHTSQFYNVWKIATDHELSEFNELAFEQLKLKSNTLLITAIDYGKKNFSGVDKRTFLNICKSHLQKLIQSKEPKFHLIKSLLEAGLDINDKLCLVTSINNLLDIHLQKYYEVIDNKNSELRFEYSISFTTILPALLEVKNEINQQYLIKLIGIDILTSSEEIKLAYKELIRVIPRKIQEDKISEIKSQLILGYNLGSLSELEKSEGTEKLFLKNIPVLLDHHINYPHLTSLIIKYWSSSTETLLIEHVSEFPWQPQNALIQMFERVIIDTAYLFEESSIIERLIPAINATDNQYSKYLLNFWIDVIKDNKN